MAQHCRPGPRPASKPTVLDRSRQPVPVEDEENTSIISTELQHISPKREDDQQPEDQPSSLEDEFFKRISRFNLYEELNLNSTIFLNSCLNPHYKSINSESMSNDSIFTPVTVSSDNSQATQAANVLSNNNSVDINTNMASHTFFLWFKKKFKEAKTYDDRINLFFSIMNMQREHENESIIDAVPAVKLPQSPPDKAEKKQFAFANIFCKDGEVWGSIDVYPGEKEQKEVNPSCPNSSCQPQLHSEQILINRIDQFLQKREIKVARVAIYTTYNPCLKREIETAVPCMFHLEETAKRWKDKYKFCTDVFFSSFWGPAPFSYFQDLTYSNVSSPESPFYEYFVGGLNIPFKLNSKEFRKLKPHDILKHSRIEDIPVNETELCSKIESVLQTLHRLLIKKDSYSLKYHQESVVQHLETLQDNGNLGNICKTLSEKWDKLVMDSFMSGIRYKITKDFNTAVVHLAVKYLNLEEGSPLHLYQVLPSINKIDMLGGGGDCGPSTVMKLSLTYICNTSSNMNLYQSLIIIVIIVLLCYSIHKLIC